MTYKPIDQKKPVYGPMGVRVTPTGWDSQEMQYRQAVIPVRTMNVGNDLTTCLIDRG